MDVRGTYGWGDWSLEALATNMTDKYYRGSENLVSNTVLAFPGEPRVVGARLT